MPPEQFETYVIVARKATSPGETNFTIKGPSGPVELEMIRCDQGVCTRNECNTLAKVAGGLMREFSKDVDTSDEDSGSGENETPKTYGG